MIDYHLLRLAKILNGTNDFTGLAWTPSSPCPSSILARVGTSGGDWCATEPDSAYCRFPNMTTIHSALVHCPAVSTLDVWFEVGGCTRPEVDRWNLPLEHLNQGQTYAALKSLRLDGYSFGVTDVKLYDDEYDQYESNWGPNVWVDSVNAEVKERWERDGENKTNLDMWIESMDWSQLEELSINTARSEMIEVASKLPQRLTSLKTLYLNSLSFIQGLGEHTLEKLSWVGKTKKGQLEQILRHQGQNLMSLEYRCNEAVCEDWPAHVNVSAIPVLAPKLQHLSINLPRTNGTWPYGDLKILFSLPPLTSADLYFRLQSECEVYTSYLGSCVRCGNAYREFKEESYKTGHCRGEQRYSSPFLNATTAQEMFSHLRSNKVGADLREATFRAGDWTGPYDGPLRSEGFLDSNRVMVVCKVDAGEDVCEAIGKRSTWDWHWNGETWVYDRDIEDYDQAEYEERFEQMEQIKDRIRKRLDDLKAKLSS